MTELALRREFLTTQTGAWKGQGARRKRNSFLDIENMCKSLHVAEERDQVLLGREFALDKFFRT